MNFYFFITIYMLPLLSSIVKSKKKKENNENSINTVKDFEDFSFVGSKSMFLPKVSQNEHLNKNNGFSSNKNFYIFNLLFYIVDVETVFVSI